MLLLCVCAPTNWKRDQIKALKGMRDEKVSTGWGEGDEALCKADTRFKKIPIGLVTVLDPWEKLHGPNLRKTAAEVPMAV